MLIRVPEYFVGFRCIADKCLDSCCIGWEIDVDGKTESKYAKLNTPLGKEIREKTSHGYFELEENGRCPFLDGKGLCRIISALGEGYLCDICREHPRYYGVGEAGIEGGLGLGCEEAARIILSIREKPEYIFIERDIRYEDEDEYAKISARCNNSLTDIIFTASTSELVGAYVKAGLDIDKRAFDLIRSDGISALPAIIPTHADDEEIRRLFSKGFDLISECEEMTQGWRELIEKARKTEICDTLANGQKLRALLYYFTHRYVREGVSDFSLGARILFALVSALSVIALAQVIDEDDRYIKAATLYSKNIEYSEDNVDLILSEIIDF